MTAPNAVTPAPLVASGHETTGSLIMCPEPDGGMVLVVAAQNGQTMDVVLDFRMALCLRDALSDHLGEF